VRRPIEPARRGHNSYFADRDPAACSDPVCDWENRPGITIPVTAGAEVYLRASTPPGAFWGCATIAPRRKVDGPPSEGRVALDSPDPNYRD